MQELHTERDFFDWLSRLSSAYGDAMAAWGQEVHDAVASGVVSQRLLDATDTAVERLVDALVSIGSWHDRRADTPDGGEAVINGLDQLLGASAELLREARAGLAEQGLPALATLSPRIAELRRYEANVEQATDSVRGQLEGRFGQP